MPISVHCLMSLGLPYDSEAGRQYAGAITALMTGEAYLQSARVADHMGPFAGYAVNSEPMLGVIDKHRAAAHKLDPSLVPLDLLSEGRKAWDEALALGHKAGYRNSQATVLAPTGTIAFMMDCDTTGIEPDIALIKYKRLVGGGLLKLVNTTVPRALKRLGYDSPDIQAIVEYIDEQETIEGALDCGMSIWRSLTVRLNPPRALGQSPYGALADDGSGPALPVWRNFKNGESVQ